MFEESHQKDSLRRILHNPVHNDSVYYLLLLILLSTVV